MTDESKEGTTFYDTRPTDPYMRTTQVVSKANRLNTDIFYKLLKKPKIKEKINKSLWDKQTENLVNIKQNISKKKLMICHLSKSVESKSSRHNSCVASDPKAEQDVFLTNLSKIQKRYTKRTTIGRSTIISHSNFRLSDVIYTGDRKKVVKIANELTIKNNNNIKVCCFNPKPNGLFSLRDFHEAHQDVYKKSTYNVMYKRITFDKDYKRVQNLQNKIKDCLIRYNDAILPKI
jgi:hypothetical protein